MSGLQIVRKRLLEIYGESCGNSITKAHIKEANVLKEDAAKAVDLAIPYALSQAKELGLSGDAVQVGPSKTLTRMFEKAFGKLDGNLEEINDVGRLRVLFDEADHVKQLRKMYGGGKNAKFTPFHPNNHVSVTGAQDYYWEPSSTGRIAFHVDLDVAISGGKSVGVEIQFIHKDMLSTEKATHLNYQKAKGIERVAKHDNRPMTADETQAVTNYRESNTAMYLADALNYDLYDLRRPDLQIKNLRSLPNLRLIA